MPRSGITSGMPTKGKNPTGVEQPSTGVNKKRRAEDRREDVIPGGTRIGPGLDEDWTDLESQTLENQSVGPLELAIGPRCQREVESLRECQSPRLGGLDGSILRD